MPKEPKTSKSVNPRAKGKAAQPSMGRVEQVKRSFQLAREYDRLIGDKRRLWRMIFAQHNDLYYFTGMLLGLRLNRRVRFEPSEQNRIIRISQ